VIKTHLQVLAFGTSIILNAPLAEPQQVTSFTYWKEDIWVLEAFCFSWSHQNPTNKMTAYVKKHCHSRTQNCNTVLSKAIIWHQPRPATNKAVKWPQTHSVGCIEEIYPIATARYQTLAILVRPYHFPDSAMRAGNLQNNCYCVLKCHIYIGEQWRGCEWGALRFNSWKGGPPRLPFNGYLMSLPAVKSLGLEADCSPPSAKVKYKWSHTPASPAICHHAMQGDFYLTYLY